MLLCHVINEIDFNHHLFNDIYESILKDIQSAGNAVESYTPRAASDFIAEILDPKFGERMAGFACGTGGFLTSTLKRLESQKKTVKDVEAYNCSVYGIEKKVFLHLLAVTNHFLHETDDPDILLGSSLESNVHDYKSSEKCDIIMMNPPFGASALGVGQKNFPAELRTSETADLFMSITMYRLIQDGRVDVSLYDGLLSGDGEYVQEKIT